MGNSIDQYSLGSRIVYFRKLRNYTQAELAEKSEVSQSTITQIESDNKDPSIETLRKISKALEIHIAVLFAADEVHVFDLKKLRKKYDDVEKLNPTLYFALGKVVAYAKEIGFLK